MTRTEYNHHYGTALAPKDRVPNDESDEGCNCCTFGDEHDWFTHDYWVKFTRRHKDFRSRAEREIDEISSEQYDRDRELGVLDQWTPPNSA